MTRVLQVQFQAWLPTSGDPESTNEIIALPPAAPPGFWSASVSVAGDILDVELELQPETGNYDVGASYTPPGGPPGEALWFDVAPIVADPLAFAELYFWHELTNTFFRVTILS